MRHEELIRAFNGEAWAITPQGMQKVLDDMRSTETRRKVSAEAVAAARDAQRSTVQTGAVAVLPLHGVVLQRADEVLEWYGYIGTESFGRRFDALVADPNISAIVLDVDSPGGAVSGTEELASKIHGARGKKRIYAVANGMAASAAYWIASAADELAVTPSGEVGSIGVYMMHLDFSSFLESEGIKPTIIKAGAHKAEGNPYEPLPDDARQHFQAKVDETYGTFLGAVAKHRGVGVATVRSDFGEGRTVLAREAVNLGMADRVTTLDEVIARAAQGKSLKSGRKAEAALASGFTPAAPVTAAAGHVAGYTIDLGELAASSSNLLNIIGSDFEQAIAERAEEIAYVKSNEPVGADTGAAPDEQETPGDQPAAEAKELPVSKDTTAANAAAETDERSPEQKRVDGLTDLAHEHGKSVSQLKGWIAGGKSAEAIGRELLSEYRAGAQPVSSNGRVQVGKTREAEKPWAHFGEFADAVMSVSEPGRQGEVDVRLHAGPDGQNVGTPSEGGFLVPPQFSQRIWDEMNEQPNNLLAMTDNYTIEGESLTIPANAETSRANGSRYGGVVGQWIEEAGEIDVSKVKFRNLKLEPHELAVAVVATDKSLRKSPIALGQYLSRAAVDEITFMVGDGIFEGAGAGKPLGLMKSGAVITVSKEASQAADTFNARNASKMWARLHPRAQAGAVWLHNIDVQPQFDSFSTTVQNVAGTENVGGFADRIYDPEKNTLKGRPLIPCEYSETLGDKGDVMLVNLGWYASGTAGGISAAMSIHVKFLSAQSVFRFMFEVDGQNWLHKPLTPFKGTNTLSNVVVLEAR